MAANFTVKPAREGGFDIPNIPVSVVNVAAVKALRCLAGGKIRRLDVDPGLKGR
jgi:hypothetical protein